MKKTKRQIIDFPQWQYEPDTSVWCQTENPISLYGNIIIYVYKKYQVCCIYSPVKGITQFAETSSLHYIESEGTGKECQTHSVGNVCTNYLVIRF